MTTDRSDWVGEGQAGKVRHAKSAANPDWPYEHVCVGCGEEWPCTERQKERLREALAEVSGD